MTSPVRTPCKHDFCKHCITEWLTQPEVNTCPVCRRSLFEPVFSASANRPRPLPLLVNDAFAAAGLMNEPWNAQTGWHSVDDLNLNDSIDWCEGRSVLLRRPARDMLIENDFPMLPQGAARIKAVLMGTSLVFMSKLLRYLAIIKSRPWGVANQGIWRQMVITIWQLVSPEDGLLLDRRNLYFAIMSALIEQQYANQDEQDHTPPTFFRQADLVKDLRYLVNFVVDHSGRIMSSDTVQEQLAAHSIEQPLVYTSNVSARAERLAAEYTSMTFVHA
jgi:hypothetical protein